MAGRGNDEGFDVLTFYIYVMAFLVVAVGVFAFLNKRKVDAESNRIKAELIKLDRMTKLAVDEDLRSWLAREREGRSTVSGTAADFEALWVQRAREHGVKVPTNASLGSRNVPGGTEWATRLQVERCRIEQLVKFLLTLEEEWPGARVRQIVKLDFMEANQRAPEGWDAVVEIAIFRASS